MRNAASIYTSTRNEGELTKSQLVSKTGLSFSSVSNLCNAMVEKGLLFADSNLKNTGGRKASAVSFNADYCYCLVVDFHHTEHFSIGVVNLASQIVHRSDFLIQGQETLEDLMDSLANAYKDIPRELTDKIAGIVVAVSAVCAVSASMLIQSANPIFEGVNVESVFESRFPNLPIIVDNDANIASLSQISFVEDPRANYIFVLLTQGVGMGIVINGSVYRGFNGYAGELGHFKVQDVDKKCKCGHKGCLRLVTTLQSIAEDLGELEILHRSLDAVSYARTLAERYQSGEKKVMNRVNLAAEKLGEAFSQLFDIFNPSIIYVGGNSWPLFPFFRRIVAQKCREYSKLASYYDLKVCFVDQSSTNLLLIGGGQRFFNHWLSICFPKVLE